LTDTISQWVPDLAKDIPNSDRVTIRELLGHRSGIRDYLTEPQFAEDGFNPALLSREYSGKDLLAYIKDKPALAEPGQSFSYSNSNYLLLGEIVEKATGTNLASQLRSRIFEPLGMNQSFYAAQEPVNQRYLTRGYTDLNGDGQIDILNRSFVLGGADGAVISTAADTAKFAQALFQGELLAPATLKMMIQDTSDRFQYINFDDYKSLPNFESLLSVQKSIRYYGLGVFSGESTELGHGGSTFGWKSQMFYRPDNQITVTALGTSEGTLDVALINLQSTVQKY
jgi:CubicO group peptidase (beta-lactamase class C family)